ncbi:GroES-like protein [Boletus reticuloceps]|uniref:alcohol dehydrogenase n=1 Tax=Boletus reticuloceps TaxID=495285 RepID=A0A8I2YZL7_9AGAM|nr:GroES-like protein [Boletus reticuloceps]
MCYHIPKTQHDFPITQPSELKPGQCLVKMIGTGVCHSVLHISRWDWPIEPVTPLVGGHEGVSEVVAIAAHTEASPVKLGQQRWDQVDRIPLWRLRAVPSGLRADAKMSGCTVDVAAMPIRAFQVSWVHIVTPVPFDSFAAASVLCAGVTVYRALKYSDARIGHWVVIPGAGGGLGHLAVQYAVAMGMRVVAIGKSTLFKLGAEKWVDFKQTPNLVSAIKEACDGLGPHAAVVMPRDAKFETSIFWTVVKNISIKGSYVGNRQDSIEAIENAASGKVKVIYALKGLSDLGQVYNDLQKGSVAGRIVLDSSK